MIQLEKIEKFSRCKSEGVSVLCVALPVLFEMVVDRMTLDLRESIDIGIGISSIKAFSGYVGELRM